LLVINLKGIKMSVKENAKYSINTGGKMQYIKQFIIASDEDGYSVDLSSIQYETFLGKTSFVKILNTGSSDVYIAFDSNHSAIDVDNQSTYNLLLSSSTPFSDIEIVGETSKISFKCNSGETTSINVITW
jgi:hypothetical protein